MTTRGDGDYKLPFKSWRVALRHVTSGDTIIAKNGDYRKAGHEGALGRAQVDADDGGSTGRWTTRSRPFLKACLEAIGIYRYDRGEPLTIRAETKQA